MVARDPAPRGAWVPIAMPGTAFGSSDRVAGALCVYLGGRIRDVVNYKAPVLEPEELIFIKLRLGGYGPPVAPAPAPEAAS